MAWKPQHRINLGPPILDFTVPDLIDRTKFVNIDRILAFWAQNDMENIRRVQTGLPLVKMPGEFTTNTVPAIVNATFWVNRPIGRDSGKAKQALLELLDWYGQNLFGSDERCGALLAGLLLRHLDPNDQIWATLTAELGRAPWLQVATGTLPTDYLYAPLDRILTKMRDKCTDANTQQPVQT